ncbi:MAG: FAD-dependent oxidoreductase [Pedobacter sp.]|nr:MAG: FAD-dependent oxidoreductase [Pedobacter sp.]
MREHFEKVDRDGATASPWQANVRRINDNSTGKDKRQLFDVIIIGGGITGLTTGLLLQQEGKRCVIVEAHSIGFGTTGGTSAHLNTFFDATYPEIESDFGETASKLVAKAGKLAITHIENWVKSLAIDCDFQKQDGYLFALDEKQSETQKDILEASWRAGVAVDKVNYLNLPIPNHSVIKFPNQAQFHPIRYIASLAKEFQRLGGIICENTFINEVDKKGELFYATSTYQVFQGQHLVYATHSVPGINSFNFKCAAYRSYVIGITLSDGNYPEGMSYDMLDVYHYYRTHELDGQKYLLIGGEDHKTGQGDPEEAFKNLEAHAREYFDVKEVSFRWSSQYYIPADGLPYIGKSSNEGEYVATGFNGNGMIFGTLSGLIIRDDILERENEFTTLFSPDRIKPIAGFTEYVQENANVAWHFIADRFNLDEIDELKEIAYGEGKVITYNGEKMAIYKDEDGNVNALSPTCTHAGCIVNFNSVEKSWDCPCHGGRFDLKGNVISGPPQKNLTRYI